MIRSRLSALAGLIALCLMASGAQAASYVLIGSDPVTGDTTSLDFDSIRPFGHYVTWTERAIYGHDPRFHVPVEHDSIVETMVGDCDVETIANPASTMFDKSGHAIWRRDTTGKPLRFAHYLPDTADVLLLKIACSRVKAMSGDTKAATPPSATAAVPLTPSVVPGRGYTGFRNKGSSVQVDNSGKGAVLCVWGIYQSLREAGAECFKDNQDLQDELGKSLDRIDQFIIANSSRPVTKAGLDARKAQALRQLHGVGDICKTDAANMYQALRSRGLNALRTSTDELLSVPREPVMNPCL